MDVAEAMNERRSTRAFKPEPVSRETIEQIIKTAVNAPSANNLQPWEITVVTGKEKERLSRTLLKAYREKRIACGSGAGKPLPATVRQRGVRTNDAMKVYTDKAGVSLSDFVNEGSCKFYGAPAAIIICLDECFSARQMVDVGTFTGYFVLAAHAAGLGTCPIGLITDYADEIKELLNISDNKKVSIGIALGYADPDSPVNHFRAARAEINELVRWL